jgi:hypothetical protein
MMISDFQTGKARTVTCLWFGVIGVNAMEGR